MAITVNLRYTGTDGKARAFVEEMMSSGTVNKIRAEEGNLRYEYYVSMEDPETVLFINPDDDLSSLLMSTGSISNGFQKITKIDKKKHSLAFHIFNKLYILCLMVTVHNLAMGRVTHTA